MKDNISDILGSLSTREIALCIWIFIGILLMLFNSNIRKAGKQTIKTFLTWKIQTVVWALIMYSAILVFVSYKLNLWGVSLLKDTVVWFVAVPFLLLFQVIGAKDNKVYLKILIEALKWTIIVEFLMNFYTFPLAVELFLIPFTSLLLLVQVVAEKDRETAVANNFLKKLITIIGWGLILFVGYKTITSFDELLTKTTLESFLLPPIFTMAIIPLLFIIGLITTYEVLYSRIDIRFKNDPKTARIVKLYLLLHANLNVSKLNNVPSQLFITDPDNFNNLAEYVKYLVSTKRGMVH